ncbi:MAG TPA: response regulator [Anaerolineae bacterium]|nr:response regulator [Anaerolineae bacterium]
MAETVLVVDNDEQTLSALSCALGAAGYTPLLAQNGVAALAHAVSQSPMFTLLAMELADMDSLALGRALRARLPETLILMLVGPNVQERIIAALRLGIVDFLTRPVDPAELTSVLARLRQQCELQQRFARVESYIASSSVTPLAEHDQRKLIEALRDTAITINSTLNLDQILERILDNVARVAPYDAANIMLLNDAMTEARIVRGRGYDLIADRFAEQVIQISFDLADAHGLQQMATTGEPHFIQDTQADPTWVVTPVSAWIRSYVGAPIQVEGRTVGFINLDSATPGSYVLQHATHLQAFANQIAIAVRNAQLYAQLQRELEQRKEAEARLRFQALLLDQIQDNIIATDLEGRMTYVNAAVMKMLQYPREVLVGQTVHILGEDPQRGATQQQIIDQTLRDGQWCGEVVNYLVDGTDRILESRVWMTRDAGGAPTGMVGVSTDITTRKQFEAERAQLLAHIQRQAQQMRQIVETVPEGLLLLDADRRIVLANPQAVSDLNILGGAQVGDTLTYLGNRPLPELLVAPPKGLWHEINTTALPARTFEAIARPIENGSAPGGWALVLRDVTYEREIQMRMQQQERLAAVGQLAAGIAHDFNNIMATIVLYSQMLARAPEISVHVQERLGIIHQQAQHATHLIRQILDFGRRNVLERRPLNLASLLKEHFKLLERTLPENITLTLHYEGDEFLVNADPTSMQQMFLNLSLNARDAMPGGGQLTFALERLIISAQQPPPLPEMAPGEWVSLTVSDTGAGIAPEHMPRLFTPFFTTKVGQGSGLGLAQIYGIVKQHAGEINVFSQVGHGTTFYIYLPALASSSGTSEKYAAESALTLGQGETVLVVEDNPATREALVAALEDLHYRPLAAANGRAALALLAAQRDIALVISDVVMPEMGGIALLRALREQGVTTPVILLTGHPLTTEQETLAAAGAAAWLLKPLSLTRLCEVVADALKT